MNIISRIIRGAIPLGIASYLISWEMCDESAVLTFPGSTLTHTPDGGVKLMDTPIKYAVNVYQLDSGRFFVYAPSVNAELKLKRAEAEVEYLRSTLETQKEVS